MSGMVNTLNKLFFIIALELAHVAVIKCYLKRKYALPIVTEKTQEKEHSPFPANAYNIVLLVVLLTGILIRVWKFGSVPGGFNQDGAMAAVDGKALADYGTDRFGTWLPAHLYAWGFGQMSSLLSYMIAIMVKINGLSPVTARMPQLFASIMGGVFFFLFMKDIFGKRVGLIAAAFVAINPWQIVQSRWALDCNLLPHFFIAGLYFLNKGLSQKKRYVYISMIFFGLCMFCYGITIYTIPPLLLAIAIYYYVKKRLTISEILIAIGVYTLVAWPFLMTMAVNFFGWDTIELPFVTIQRFSDSVRSGDILLFSDHFFSQLKANFQSLLNTSFYQRKDLPWNDVAGFGTMFLFTMPFVVTGIISLKDEETEGNKALVVFALLAGVWAGLLTNYVNVNRVNIIYYGVMMFAVLGIDFIFSEIRISKCAIPVMYILAGVLFVGTYFTSYAQEIAGCFYEGFGDALRVAEDSGAQRIYVTADAQGKGYRGTSEILTMFYDKTDAKYFQGVTNMDHGKEYWAYNQRFIYDSMSLELAENTWGEDAAYVIMADDREFFDEAKYEITEFGRFCSAVKIGD